jgi:hypothetical protein
MLVFRLFIAVLNFAFLLLNLVAGSVEFLQGTVTTCGLLFLIFDIRKDVDDIKQLEAQLASLANGA